MEEFVEVNGQRLHVLREGAGKLMLFVHGFPEFSGAWAAQLAEFGRDHLAVAPDLRGFNLSSKPAETKDYRPKHLVGDLLGLIDHYSPNAKAIVVAHDWGGAVAWNLAAQHADRIERLVIVNSPHPATFARDLAQDAEQQAASAYMNFFRRPGAEKVMAEDNFRRLFAMLTGPSGESVLNEAEKKAYAAAWAQPGAIAGGLNYYRASPLHPPQEGDPGAAAVQIDPKMFRVEILTLVIWGEADKALRPSLLDGLDAFIPDLRLVRIPEGSHWIIHEQPARVNALIRDFIPAA
jgi:pimeloyl-ACP methyl ester carboxylesterase